MHISLAYIGSVVAQARKTAKRTQGDLAQSLRMSRATISGIENGTVREIGVRKLMALCDAVGLELTVMPKRTRPTLQQLRAELREAKTHR